MKKTFYVIIILLIILGVLFMVKQQKPTPKEEVIIKTQGTFYMGEAEGTAEIMKQTNASGINEYYLKVTYTYQGKTSTTKPVRLVQKTSPHGVIIRDGVINVYYTDQDKNKPFTTTTPITFAAYYQLSTDGQLTDVSVE